MNSVQCVQVAIPLPVRDPFSYVLANGRSASAEIGSRVLVPFRNRHIQGYIVGVEEKPQVENMKEVEALIDQEPILDPAFLKLTRWMSEYYVCSWGEAIENALPKAIKRGMRQTVPEDSPRDAEGCPVELVLNREQEEAFAAIRTHIHQGGYQAILLHGVTGSGKTEIYIRAIKAVLEMGREAICLVPEIALTTQIRDFFAGHFQGILEIIHSRLTDRERLQAWLRIRAGRSRVILGPRSALFAPVRKLGLIIIDEEHENSYKQAESPRYHAREVAKKRAEIEGAVLILGGATPSLETMHEAEEGELSRFSLTKRVVEREMPRVQVVDLKREIENHGKLSMFSYPLQREVGQALANKESVLLLLNRRGFATQVHCLRCGEIIQCRHCRLALTYHQAKKILLCHYCNFQMGPPEKCPSCAAPELKFVGWGTEKIESEIARFFPSARVARLDTDVARRKGSLVLVLGTFFVLVLGTFFVLIDVLVRRAGVLAAGDGAGALRFVGGKRAREPDDDARDQDAAANEHHGPGRQHANENLGTRPARGFPRRRRTRTGRRRPGRAGSRHRE